MATQPHSRKRVCYYYDSKYTFNFLELLILPSWLFIVCLAKIVVRVCKISCHILSSCEYDFRNYNSKNLR